MHLEADGLLPCEEQSYKTRRPHSLLPRPLAHLSSAISVTDHAYWTFFSATIISTAIYWCMNRMRAGKLTKEA